MAPRTTSDVLRIRLVSQRSQRIYNIVPTVLSFTRPLARETSPRAERVEQKSGCLCSCTLCRPTQGHLRARSDVVAVHTRKILNIFIVVYTGYRQCECPSFITIHIRLDILLRVTGLLKDLLYVQYGSLYIINSSNTGKLVVLISRGFFCAVLTK